MGRQDGLATGLSRQAVPSFTGTCMDKSEASQKSSPKLNWTGLTKIGAISAAVGGLSLHLMGHVTHRFYLHQMGADAGLFPKTTDWLVINGYYALGGRLLSLLEAFLAHAWWIVLAAVVLGCYLYGMEALGRWLKTKAPITGLPWLPSWASDLLRNLFLSSFVVIGIPVAAMWAMLIFLLPAVVGEIAGKDVAAKEMALFMAGCDNKESSRKVQCSEIAEDGKVVATGYVIDASQSHIAIFDPVARRTVVTETGKKVIVRNPLNLSTD